jgi:hypothetical protein
MRDDGAAILAANRFDAAIPEIFRRLAGPRQVVGLRQDARLQLLRLLARDDESVELLGSLHRRDVPVGPHALQIDLAVVQARRTILTRLCSGRSGQQPAYIYIAHDASPI